MDGESNRCDVRRTGTSMTEKSQLVKRKNPNRIFPKDWDRRTRVIAVLSQKHMTQEELARKLEVSEAYVSATIWGHRRLYSIESAIAQELNCTWESLFAPLAEGRVA